MKTKLKICQYEHHGKYAKYKKVVSMFASHWGDIVDATCCAKVPYPELQYKEGDKIIVPKLHPISYMIGLCNECGATNE